MRSPIPKANKSRWPIVIIVCVCVIVLGLGIYHYIIPARDNGKESNTADKGATPVLGRSEPDEFGRELKPGITLEGTKIILPEPGGALGWEFCAERIEYDSKNNHVYLVGAEGEKFINGKPDIKIQAGYIGLDLESDQIDLKDRVIIESKQDQGFSAECAVWDSCARKFKAYGNVLYKNNSSEISGDEMEIDLEFEKARVKGNVRLHIYASSD